MASFANVTSGLPHEEAEKAVEENVRAFEKEKDYLVQRWKELGAGLVCSM